MKTTQMLQEMFELQQFLNDETNGEGWEKGYTKQGRIINWRRCIYMECAELIDSFNWKHWKDIDLAPDWENIKIEIVDIWHFVMSLGLESYKEQHLGTIEDIVSFVVDAPHFSEFCKEPIHPDDEDTLCVVNSIEHMMKDALEHAPFDKLVDDFIEISLLCGVNLDILYRFYLAKNVLNSFRQEHGYKEGHYLKNWNGKEDNEVMLELLETKPMGAKELYDALELAYSKVAS